MVLAGEFAAVLSPLNKYRSGFKPAASHTQVCVWRASSHLSPPGFPRTRQHVRVVTWDVGNV